VEASGVEEPRAGQMLGALGPRWTHALAVLLDIDVGRGLAVDEDQAGRAALWLAVAAELHRDAVAELRIEILLEEIRRFHDVHVGVDEPEAVLHECPPEWARGDDIVLSSPDYTTAVRFSAAAACPLTPDAFVPRAAAASAFLKSASVIP